MALDHPAAQSVALATMLPVVGHGYSPELLLAVPGAIYYGILVVERLLQKKRGEGDHH